MLRRPSLCAAAALLLAAACSPPGPPVVDTAADEQALTALAEREMTAFTSGDLESVGQLFAPDATIMPPNEPTITGIEAIQTWTAGLHEQFMVTGRYTTVENKIAGDFAYQWMTFELAMTPQAGGETMTERGRGLHILARQPDGSWKIVLDIWNSTIPLEGM